MRDADLYAKYMNLMGSLVNANQERLNLAEKCQKFVKGGKWQWEDGVFEAMESMGRPVISDNQVRRNIILHAGYHLQNAYDFKWEGSNEDPNAPIELANLYHYHVRNANHMDFVDLMVYIYGCTYEGVWEYYWGMAEDGAKDIRVDYHNGLGIYKDPQCMHWDYGGPKANILGWGKFVRTEDLAAQFPQYAGKLKEQLEVIKKKGYDYKRYEDEYHLKGRAAEFYDEYQGMPKLMEIWDYEYKESKSIYDLDRGEFSNEAPRSSAAQDQFMRIPGNVDKFSLVPRKEKVLMRRMFCSILPEIMLVNEPHDNPIYQADGQVRMPIVPFSSVITDDESQGFVIDAMGEQMSLNKMKSSNLFAAVTNSAPNKYHDPEDYEHPNEAKRREQNGALPGMRPYRMKRGRVNPPKQEEPGRIDPESHKIVDNAPSTIRDLMMAPDVIAGVQEKQETLGQFEGRRESALTALGPTNAIWAKSQISCADCEWSMMQSLGEEGITRFINSGPNTDLFPMDDDVPVNVPTARGIQNDLASIPRGKVTVVQITYSPSHRAHLLEQMIKVRGLFPNPQVATEIDPIIAEQLPIPKEHRDKIANALQPAAINQLAGAPGAGGGSATPEEVAAAADSIRAGGQPSASEDEIALAAQAVKEQVQGGR